MEIKIKQKMMKIKLAAITNGLFFSLVLQTFD
jgi:hypothetical protein